MHDLAQSSLHDEGGVYTGAQEHENCARIGNEEGSQFSAHTGYSFFLAQPAAVEAAEVVSVCAGE